MEWSKLLKKTEPNPGIRQVRDLKTKIVTFVN